MCELTQALQKKKIVVLDVKAFKSFFFIFLKWNLHKADSAMTTKLLRVLFFQKILIIVADVEAIMNKLVFFDLLNDSRLQLLPAVIYDR